MVDHLEWYELPDSELAQGDVIVAVDVYAYEPGADRPRFRVHTANVVVLTQTCDIPKAKQSTILLAELDSYDDIVAKRGDGQQGEKWRKKVVANEVTSDFLLPPNPSYDLGWSLINFRELYVLPKSEFTGERLAERRRVAIASPYREHLSQAYARFTMRVGLPNTLHDFVDHKPPA